MQLNSRAFFCYQCVAADTMSWVFRANIPTAYLPNPRPPSPFLPRFARPGEDVCYLHASAKRKPAEAAWIHKKLLWFLKMAWQESSYAILGRSVDLS